MKQLLKKKKINSKQKGSRGERDLRDFFKDQGLNARRSQQFAGGTESSDVLVEEWKATHIECKFTEHVKPYDFVAQAIKDSGGEKLPVVFWRRNGKEWLAMFSAEDACYLLSMRELLLSEARITLPVKK